MRLDQYTDDTLCNAMGLGQFALSSMPRVIRVLLKPSFHPEVCVTLETTQLHVVALRSMLWHEPIPCHLPTYTETLAIARPQFEAAAYAFELAIAEHAARPNRMCLDGMVVSALYFDGDRRSQFEGHSIGPKQEAFVAQLLRLAHESTALVYLRNRIAGCGRYVDRTFKVEPEPELPRISRMLVLGMPDDRSAYFELLRQRTAGESSP